MNNTYTHTTLTTISMLENWFQRVIKTNLKSTKKYMFKNIQNEKTFSTFNFRNLK